MNKRINELAEQAYVEVPHERDWDATSQIFDKEKFAELIINQCMYVGRLAQIENKIVDSEIKDYFGIK